MKILWLSNCNLTASNVSGTGTWLYAMSNALIEKGVEIINVTTGNVRKKIKIIQRGIVQYIVPMSKIRHGLPSKIVISDLQQIEDVENPDLIHIWGMESFWGVLSARGYFKTVSILEIQGVLGSISKYYTANLTTRELLRCYGIFEMIFKSTSIYYIKNKFASWGKMEQEMLMNHHYISTQSDWVRAHILPFIANDAQIFKTRMAVRDNFYKDENKWSFSGSHTIIAISSDPLPYKGVHDVIRALSLIVKKYPDANLQIVGRFRHEKSVWKRPGYTRFLQLLIKDYGLEQNVSFTGPLNADSLCALMKSSGVMVVPSYVESYCLTMAESMAVGLPCVASFAGALPELAVDCENALYFPSGDYAVMASMIIKLFDNPVLSENISRKSHITALKRNDKNAVCARQMDIYKRVLNFESNK